MTEDRNKKTERVLPLISVIVPVYNVEKYVGECIVSVCRQTYRNLEIIIVNDGSTDQSDVICRKYAAADHRIRLIEQENKGLSEARNVGMQNASGEYFFFVDSDDMLCRETIQKLYEAAQIRHAFVAICGYYELSARKTKQKVGYEEDGELSVNDVFCEMFTGRKIGYMVWNKLYHRDVWNEIRFPAGCVFEDIMTIPAVFAGCNTFAVTSYCGYIHRYRSESITNRMNQTHMKEYLTAIRMSEKILEKNCAAVYQMPHRKELRYMRSYFHLWRKTGKIRWTGEMTPLYAKQLYRLFYKHRKQLRYAGVFDRMQLRAAIYFPGLYLWMYNLRERIMDKQNRKLENSRVLK